jgi:hypothetical protein
MARLVKIAAREAAVEDGDKQEKQQRKYLSYRNERLWTRIW